MSKKLRKECYYLNQSIKEAILKEKVILIKEHQMVKEEITSGELRYPLKVAYQ